MTTPAPAAPDTPRRRGGRPPKTKRPVHRPRRDEPVEAYLRAIRDGHGPTTAAGRAGVTWQAAQQWRKDEAFLVRENAALADYADALTSRVRMDAARDADLALKVLARRVPKDWAPPERHEVSGPDGDPVPIRYWRPGDDDNTTTQGEAPT